jgi:hypothetical protein
MSNPAVASAWGKRTASLKACLQKPLARPRLFGLGFGRLLCEAFDLGEAFDLAYPRGQAAVCRSLLPHQARGGLDYVCGARDTGQSAGAVAPKVGLMTYGPAQGNLSASVITATTLGRHMRFPR